VFPDQENMEKRKNPPNESAFREWLAQPDLGLGPVTLRINEAASLSAPPEPNALIVAEWGGRKAEFVAEYKSLSTPKAIAIAILQAERLAALTSKNPLVVVPYLSEEKLRDLERRKVSGVDLCGNGVLLCTAFNLWRSGQPNVWAEPSTLRNAYMGDSSIFVRSFLLRQVFPSLRELREYCVCRTLLRQSSRGLTLRLGTASKAIQNLCEELIVARNGRELRLLDPNRLLANLRELYRKSPMQSLLGKTPLSREELWQRLAAARRVNGLRAAASGISSAEYYGLLSGVERLTLYVDDLKETAGLLEIREGRSFANIELVEAQKNLLFFDVREQANAVWASPIQTWLELAQAGPREQEAAKTMERRLAAGKGEQPR
jgi:hypothetical protein